MSKCFLFMILISATVCHFSFDTNRKPTDLNDCKNMTIGIVGNPNPYLDENFTQIKYDKNYINWLQNRGAVAVPISTFLTDKELEIVLSKLNGVLLPGGSVDLKPNGKFENFILRVIKKIMKLNENGNKIALWGTCQGLEIIDLLLSEVKTREEFFQRVEGMQNITMPTLPYRKNIKNWDLGLFLYERDLLYSYTKENVNCHLHDWSVPISAFAEGKPISKYLYITSIQKDIKGRQYVDTFQSYEPYNIHGVQFHPDVLVDEKFYLNTFGEKNWFIAKPVSEAMADFFIERSRMSSYCYINDEKSLFNFDDFQSSGECNESYFYFENDKNHEGEPFKCKVVETIKGVTISKNFK